MPMLLIIDLFFPTFTNVLYKLHTQSRSLPESFPIHTPAVVRAWLSFVMESLHGNLLLQNQNEYNAQCDFS